MAQTVICKFDNHDRDANLKTPCEMCGRRKTIFGYRTESEHRSCLLSLILIITVIALLIGASVFVFMYLQLQLVNLQSHLGSSSLSYLDKIWMELLS